MNRDMLSSRLAVAFATLAIAALTGLTQAAETPEFAVPPEQPTQIDGSQAGRRLVEATALIRAAEARNTFQVDGSGLTAAVLDTGLRTTHVDFAGKVLAQRNFTSDNGGNANNAADGQGHGTNVSGIVCANGNHTGFAPGANVVALKVLSNTGGGSFTQIEQAIDFVIANRVALNITVVNMSLGSGQNLTSTGSTSFRTKIQQLRNARVAVVVAAGNDFFPFNSQQGMSFPAIIPETVSVGAVYDANAGGFNYNSGAQAFSTGPNRIAPFSQRLHPNLSAASRTDIFAPGAAILSSGIAHDTAGSTMHGTSQAAPCVAGVILLLQQHVLRATGQLPTVDQIEAFLRNGSVTINDGDDEDDNVLNTGLNFPRIDALAALQATGIAPPSQNNGNSAPQIVSGPVASPDTVLAGDTVDFSVAASDADGDPLTFSWNFNDGFSGSGAFPSHAFAAAGIYDVSVTVSDGQASTSANISVTVVDANQLSLLTVDRLATKLAFNQIFRDQAKLKARANLNPFTDPFGVTGAVNIGGILEPFVLDERGRGFLFDGTIKVNFVRGTINVSLRNGDFAGTWEPLGMINADVAGDPVAVPVLVVLDGQSFIAQPTLFYKARFGKSGSAK